MLCLLSAISICSRIAWTKKIKNKKKNYRHGNRWSKARDKTPWIISHTPLPIPPIILPLWLELFLRNRYKDRGKRGVSTPEIKNILTKKKKRKNESKTVINKMKRTEGPGHSSAYFHRTSMLVCVMTTLSREEQGNVRLPAWPVSEDTCWSGNRVQEPEDTPPPAPPPPFAAAAVVLALPLVD